jgi:hypothetical protein
MQVSCPRARCVPFFAHIAVQVIASRVKKAIAAASAVGGSAADIGSDGRHRCNSFKSRFPPPLQHSAHATAASSGRVLCVLTLCCTCFPLMARAFTWTNWCECVK